MASIRLETDEETGEVNTALFCGGDFVANWSGNRIDTGFISISFAATLCQHAYEAGKSDGKSEVRKVLGC